MKIRLLFLITGVTLAGCRFGGGFTHFAPSIGSKTSSPNEDFMYLDLNEAYYDNLGIEPPLYEINTTEEADDSARRDSVSNCEILYDEEEPAAPELICILDYMEEEFLTYDLSIVLNIPKGMCAHLRSMPSWHYNRKMGDGPRVLCQVTETTEGEGDAEDTETESLCLPDGWTRDNPDSWEVETYTCPTEIRPGCSEDAEDHCPYIYTNPNGDKLNCCLGPYDIIGSTDSGRESWGGNAQNCMGGPGRTSWNEYNPEGFPAYLAEYILEDGLRRTYEISNLINTSGGGGYSTPIANYIEDLDKPPEELQEEELEFPSFLDQENNLPQAGLFYTFICTDSAGDILHKINLMIREWNTHEEFMAHYDSGGDDESANPDVTGEEGDDCQYENRRLFGVSTYRSSCNDFCDMDDIIQRPEDCPNNIREREGCDGYPCARYE